MKVAIPAFALVLAACAPPSTVKEDAAADGAPGERFRRRSDVISERELAATSTPNLYDAIQQLRPRFLQRRGESSITRREGTIVVVYIDDVRAGSPESLRSVHPSEVLEVRYLDGPSASSRYGLNHGGGAIVVQRKRGGPPS